MNKSQHLGFSPHDHTFKVRVILQQNSISLTLLVMNKSQHPGFLSLLPNNLTHFKDKCQASGFATVLGLSILFLDSVLRLKLPDEDRKGDPKLSSDNTMLWRECTFTVLSQEHSATLKLHAKVGHYQGDLYSKYQTQCRGRGKFNLPLFIILV